MKKEYEKAFRISSMEECGGTLSLDGIGCGIIVWCRALPIKLMSMDPLLQL